MARAFFVWALKSEIYVLRTTKYHAKPQRREGTQRKPFEIFTALRQSLS